MKHKSEDDIDSNLREMRCDSVRWIRLAQDSVQTLETMNTAKNLLISRKKRSFFGTGINHEFSITSL